MIRVVLIAALIAASGAATAGERKVYAGDEAKALKCAFVISATANTLETAGFLGRNYARGANVISYAILQKYVSGTERQKLAALKAVGARRDVNQTLTEFQAEAKACLRKFPID
ncbi:hypothetical protein VK792_03540 [Mesobacterium sp. TK19101]|uniref:Valyl-tRNA synthetase n=1 Tax=Mesobacterium hydrothermale TaxID=3111907 RepID=A0ABU6HGW6_9RHOB|nr:hypothetical protein [Mesobacterium sp. TK19101]MEC3860345.1 hypothetical protein [Mesobacterium sp. TK19101]